MTAPQADPIDDHYGLLLGRAPDERERLWATALLAEGGARALLRYLLQDRHFEEAAGEDFFASLAAVTRIPGFAAVLGRFPPALDVVPPPGFWSDWLGGLSRCDLWVKWQGRSGRNLAFRSLQGYEIEWAALLEAALAAGPRASFMELGAGWGPWSVRAALALRRYRPDIDCQLIAVEAEPTYRAKLERHFRDNGLDPSAHRLVAAAVAPQAGEASFPAAERAEDEWSRAVGAWGEAAAADERKVPAVALADLLTPLASLDLLHCDIQGREIDVLTACPTAVFDGKVKRLLLGTHGRDIEAAAIALLAPRGWSLRAEAPCQLKLRRQGPRLWRDGAQYWINAALTATPPAR